MKKLKYIIADGSPILFGEATNHSDVARGFNVTNAGFCSIDFVKGNNREIDDKYKVTCYGESVTLDKKSDPEFDAGKIERMINYY